ncbi:hypothetical protein EXIGLDRAFT_561551, partial [Exidia glandulosa HHB12029]
RSYFFTQMPQPMQRISDMNAILSVDLTSIHNLPEMRCERGHSRRNWSPHRLGLHLLESTIAILVILSAIMNL